MRPSLHQMYFGILNVVKQRSTCLRRRVGCLITAGPGAVAIGYNGTISGSPHCSQCLRQELEIPSGQRHEICRAIHAEQNAIAQAAYYGIPVHGATMYITHKPCIICFKLIMQAGISKILYKESYPDEGVDAEIRYAGMGIYKMKKENYYTIKKRTTLTAQNLTMKL